MSFCKELLRANALESAEILKPLDCATRSSDPESREIQVGIADCLSQLRVSNVTPRRYFARDRREFGARRYVRGDSEPELDEDDSNADDGFRAASASRSDWVGSLGGRRRRRSSSTFSKIRYS